MLYRVVDHANEEIGGVFRQPADARAVIDEIIDEGQENEVNWLMELVHAVQEGGSVNMQDAVYVNRILLAPLTHRREVAVGCAIERICADFEIVGFAEA